MTESLYIQLLGEFHMQQHDAALSFSPLEQALLAYLLLHRDTPQSRQQIAFLFWPDSTDAQARGQLRKLYYRMRRRLPDADRYLLAETQTVQWLPEGPYTLDVAEFERALDEAERALDEAERARDEAARARIDQALEQAVHLYHGDLLPSCYDDWIIPLRARLSQRFVHALERLIALLQEDREYERAIAYAERLLRYDPLHETCYQALMRLHALTGDRARALRIYHTCATVLQRELDVEPSPSTRQAYERLLHAEPAVPPEPDRQAPTVPVSEPSPIGLAVVTPLVGRHDEWRRLRALWQGASQGMPQAALIQGEAGIGKTRLAEELIRWVQRQGGAAYTARCYAAEGTLAYAPVVQWLRAGPLPPLEPAWRRELARLLPELLDAGPDLTPPGPMTEPWQRQRFFQALARAFLGASAEGRARRPLLLLLDDVQWCDPETLEWLHYLLRYDPRAPLLVLCTLRVEEMDDEHPLAAWLRAMRREGRLSEFSLGPLSEDETHLLASQVAKHKLDADLIACIYGETEGNPLFVVELARAGRLVAEREPECPPQGLPPRIQSTIEDRLAQLSPTARELVGLAATIGREFTFAVLAGASALAADALLRALDELWQRRVVREQGGDEYDFTHDKLRQVAYARMSEARQREMHRHVAGALETVHVADLDEVSGQVAAHYERAGEAEHAIPHHLRVAQGAAEVFANRDAADHYLRVLALLPDTVRGEQAEQRFQVLSGLGQVGIRLGQPARAAAWLADAIDLGRSLSCPVDQIARLYYWHGQALFGLRRYVDQIRAGREGLSLLELTASSVLETPESKGPASLEAALLLSMVASGYDYTGDRVRGRALWYRVADMVRELPYTPELGFVYSQVAIRYLRDKDLDGIQRWLHLVESRAASSDDELVFARIHERREQVLSRQGDLRSALDHLRQALDHIVHTGNLVERFYYTWWIAFRRLALGDFAQAELGAQRSLVRANRLDTVQHKLWASWLWGLVLLCQDNLPKAEPALDRAIHLATESENPEAEVLSDLALGRACLDRGEREAALPSYQRAAALCTPAMLANWRAREMYAYGRIFAAVLNGLEGAFSDRAAFCAFCRQLPGWAPFHDGTQLSPDLSELALGQWFLESAEPDPLPGAVDPPIDERFQGWNADALPEGWTWHDPFGDCRYAFQNGLVIEAANGRGLWKLNQSAPRILAPLPSLSSGAASGVVLETVCAPADVDKPAMGGLLIWVDAKNYLRLDRGLSGPNEITLLGCLEDRDVLLGRGRLPPAPAGAGAPGRLERAWLRFEWRAGRVRALCSADGETWYTAGAVDLPWSADAQFGVYACGDIDRCIHHGAYPDGAALRFALLRCWIE